MHRRQFLTASLAGLAALLYDGRANTAPIDRYRWLTGYGTRQGGFGLAGIDSALQPVSLLDCPFRLHDVIRHPAGHHICLPARRPGRAFIILRDTRPPITVNAPDGRHFYGHAAYSKDGERLYLTENDYENSRGVVGIYQTSRGYRRLGEMASGGVGPHDLFLHADGRHLIVANGGIATHPESGRAKLNLETMAPGLSMLDLRTGHPVAHYLLPGEMQNLSLRHITMAANGNVLFGLQDQFPGLEDLALVGLWRPGSDATFLMPPADGWATFRGYIGSLEVDRTGSIVGAVSPKGGFAAFWHTRTGALMGTYRDRDICGIAAATDDHQFLVTSGVGVLSLLQPGPDTLCLARSAQTRLRFDNHCFRA